TTPAKYASPLPPSRFRSVPGRWAEPYMGIGPAGALFSVPGFSSTVSRAPSPIGRMRSTGVSFTAFLPADGADWGAFPAVAYGPFLNVAIAARPPMPLAARFLRQAVFSGSPPLLRQAAFFDGPSSSTVRLIAG